MHDLPTRGDLARSEKLAKRLLNNHKTKEVRVLAKNYLRLVTDLDAYTESLYPCFDILDRLLRFDHAIIAVSEDGTVRMTDPKTGKVLLSGKSLKDLAINAVLWHGDWPDKQDFAEICHQEDIEAGIEPIIQPYGPSIPLES